MRRSPVQPAAIIAIFAIALCGFPCGFSLGGGSPADAGSPAPPNAYVCTTQCQYSLGGQTYTTDPKNFPTCIPPAMRPAPVGPNLEAYCSVDVGHAEEIRIDQHQGGCLLVKCSIAQNVTGSDLERTLTTTVDCLDHPNATDIVGCNSCAANPTIPSSDPINCSATPVKTFDPDHDVLASIDSDSNVTFTLSDGSNQTVPAHGSISFTVPPASCASGCTISLDSAVATTDDFTISGLIHDTHVKNVRALALGESEGDLLSDGSFELPAGSVSTTVDLEVDGTPKQSVLVADAPVRGRLDFVGRSFALSGSFAGSDGTKLTIDFSGALRNQPPRAIAGPDQTVECTSPNGALVRLDGSASSDPDGNIAIFSWAVVSGPGAVPRQIGTGPVLTVQLPLGEHDIQLSVMDSDLQFDTTRVHVSVRDTTAPVIKIDRVDPDCLWPPEHRLAYFRLGTDIAYRVDDACDASPQVRIASVESSESGIYPGSGSTAPDAFMSPDAACVRAERSGLGLGRVYSIDLAARDASGNVSKVTASVSVPHDASAARCHISPTRLLDDGDPRCGSPAP